MRVESAASLLVDLHGEMSASPDMIDDFIVMTLPSRPTGPRTSTNLRYRQGRHHRWPTLGDHGSRKDWPALENRAHLDCRENEWAPMIAFTSVRFRCLLEIFLRVANGGQKSFVRMVSLYMRHLFPVSAAPGIPPMPCRTSRDRTALPLCVTCFPPVNPNLSSRYPKDRSRNN